MNKRQTLQATLLILAAFAVLAGAFAAILCVADTPDIVGYDEYIVAQGETLWSIAEESNGYGQMDRRDIIADIQAESGCGSDIRAGQTVYIPIYKLDK